MWAKWEWYAAETMPRMLDPFRFLLIAVAGWMNQPQQHAIEYLQEENRILREQLGNRRLRLTDDQRRSLAAKPGGSEEGCWRNWQPLSRRRHCCAGTGSSSRTSTTAVR